MSDFSVGVLMDLPPEHAYHRATVAALGHAAAAVDVALDVQVITTDRLAGRGELRHDAVVIGPGSPYRDPEAVLAAIRSARERGVPLVGT